MPRGNGNINIFKFQNTKNQQTKKCSWNTKQTRKQKLISISFTLGNDSFFLFVVCMSSFVNCDWGIKTHILIKLHILFLVVMHFFSQVCVCVFFSHPMEASHVYSYIFFVTVLRPYKNTCIFSWVIIIVHCITKVSVCGTRWYVSVARERQKLKTEKSVAFCYLGHCCIRCDSTAEKYDAINLYVNVIEKCNNNTTECLFLLATTSFVRCWIFG